MSGSLQFSGGVRFAFRAPQSMNLQSMPGCLSRPAGALPSTPETGS